MKIAQDEKHYKMDELDTKVVTLLQSNGRMANTEIARKLGVAEATVRKRIARLVNDNVIQFGAWADPLKVGYQSYTYIELQVELSQLERVAERVAALPEIFFLGVCTGTFDIFAAAVFRSNDHLYEFLSGRLTKVPGIQRVCTSNLIRIVKREYTFPALFVARSSNSSRGRRRTKLRGKGIARDVV